MNSKNIRKLLEVRFGVKLDAANRPSNHKSKEYEIYCKSKQIYRRIKRAYLSADPYNRFLIMKQLMEKK